MARTRKAYIPRIGSISDGTCLARDVLDSMLWELRGAKLTRDQRNAVRRAEAVLNADGLDDVLAHEEALDDARDSVWEIMESLALDYMYFGANTGDGAAIGYWPCDDSIDEDRRNGDLPDTDSVAADYRGLSIEVNDHGNMTLYRHDGRGGRSICWDCV